MNGPPAGQQRLPESGPAQRVGRAGGGGTQRSEPSTEAGCPAENAELTSAVSLEQECPGALLPHRQECGLPLSPPFLGLSTPQTQKDPGGCGPCLGRSSIPGSPVGVTEVRLSHGTQDMGTKFLQEGSSAPSVLLPEVPHVPSWAPQPAPSALVHTPYWGTWHFSSPHMPHTSREKEGPSPHHFHSITWGRSEGGTGLRSPSNPLQLSPCSGFSALPSPVSSIPCIQYPLLKGPAGCQFPGLDLACPWHSEPLCCGSHCPRLPSPLGCISHPPAVILIHARGECWL